MQRERERERERESFMEQTKKDVHPYMQLAGLTLWSICMCSMSLVRMIS
jgi:hypothetical protein